MVSQVEALRNTVEALHLGPEHAALIAYCEGLGAQIDLHPARATLWREYRPAVALLLSQGDVGHDDAEVAFLKLVGTPVSTEVRDEAVPGA